MTPGQRSGNSPTVWVPQLAFAMLLGLPTLGLAGSTSSDFGLSPHEIGALQTPSPTRNQLFSSPLAVADHTDTTVEAFIAHRLESKRPQDHVTYIGAAIFVPFVAHDHPAWLAGIGFGLGNPTFGLFQAQGDTRSQSGSLTSRESLDLRTTINARPHRDVDLAIGIRSLARLIGSIDVIVADAENQTYVINRLVTVFRPEAELQWKSESTALRIGYRHRLAVDYKVPINAALEDPVPLDLPPLSIQGRAFVEPAALWLSGTTEMGMRSLAWRLQLELPESQGVGLSGLTPSETRDLPPIQRRWHGSISTASQVSPDKNLDARYALGLSYNEGDPMSELQLRAGGSLEIEAGGERFSLGCAMRVALNAHFDTLVCSLGAKASWENSQ